MQPDVVLVSNFLAREEADALLARIRSESEFKQNRINLYGWKNGRGLRPGRVLGTIRLPTASASGRTLGDYRRSDSTDSLSRRNSASATSSVLNPMPITKEFPASDVERRLLVGVHKVAGDGSVRVGAYARMVEVNVGVVDVEPIAAPFYNVVPR